MNFTILYNSYFNTLICNSKDGIDKDMNKKIASNWLKSETKTAEQCSIKLT